MTLRVTLEIVPFGDETKKRTIRQLDIFNMGQVPGSNNYEYGVIDIDPEKNTGGLYQETVYHLRDHGASALVSKVLRYLIQFNE
jgi:hypothetical protein